MPCHPDSQGKQSAGKKGIKLFIEIHPELSLRKPEAASAATVKFIGFVSYSSKIN
jgi:hypothetical protein